jgi:nucleotide-binding universal stress UspA family protein
VLSEALLDLNRFLEDHLALMRHVPKLTKRVVLGPIAQQIVKVAEDEQVDLVIMSPRRHRGFRRVINAGITDAVIRLSPCPVLSVTAPLPSKPWRGRLVPAPLAWPNAKVVNG